ncbi:MAG: hypothetical protein PWP27_1457 [Clostridiales bacterium]|jgi:hypothetical protein|nr:hypothetical protein [Clostridiales bacterium]MDK2933647.1 hypothetical protein [Clostridiales bacterium]
MVNIVSATMKKMIEYFDGDVKRINHALKVYGFAKSIGELENIQEEKLKILYHQNKKFSTSTYHFQKEKEEI